MTYGATQADLKRKWLAREENGTYSDDGNMGVDERKAEMVEGDSNE
jgi:hypothetical protein